MTIICSICIDNLSESDSVSLPCGHAFDRNCILQCLNSVAACPLCKQSCSISQVRRLYLSTENNTFEQRDLVLYLQDKTNKLSKALDQANSSLLSSKITLKSAQDKCESLQRDHQRKDRELSKAVERITQLTEVNRNSQLAYNHLLEENKQYSRKLSSVQEASHSSSQDQWWRQLKEEKDEDIETEIKRFVSNQKKEQKKRKLTYNGLQTMVNDSIAKNNEILKVSKKENASKSRDKTSDLYLARTKVKSSIKAFKSAWGEVEENYEDLVNNYNHVKKEFDSVIAMSSELDKRIVKFRSSVLKTRSGHEEMQQKMNIFNAIASRNDQPAKKPRVQRRSDGISIVLFYSS